MGKLVGLLGLRLCFHGADPPPRFPFGSLWGGPMAVEPACLVVSLATRLCTRTVFVSPSATHGQELVGLLGLVALLPWG